MVGELLGNQSRIVNYLSIDVEDYFHVSAFESLSPPASWCGRELRVEKNTDKILSILNAQSVKATFFVLVWVAEHCSDLVKRIAAQGHEIASHGYGHQRVCNQSREEFREDIRHSKALLEDISGHAVLGYRAPSYSINHSNMWVHDELYETGHIYSSSVYPVKHDLYGIPDAPRFKYTLPNGLIEIPISTIKILSKNLPAGGGGFFRFYPYPMSKWIIKHINKKDQQAAIFYFHPWELDPEQPRQDQASLKSKFRHYLNLHKTEARLSQLLTDFNWDRMDKVYKIS